MRPQRALVVCFVLALALVASATLALERRDGRSFDTIVVFGDSTSDNGNVYRLLNHTFPPLGYWRGRFSNGPIWVDYLARMLCGRLVDYAYGGATTDNNYVLGVTGTYSNETVPDIQQQIANLFGPHAARFDPDKTLFVIGFQGNDYLNNPKANVIKIVANIVKSWNLLKRFGARYIMMNRFFDISSLPYVKASQNVTQQAAVKALSIMHNKAFRLAAASWSKYNPDIHLYLLPLDELWDELQQPERLRELGITDHDHSCVKKLAPVWTKYTICKDPSKYFYWDEIHPTTKIHREVAKSALKTLKDCKASDKKF